MGNRSILICNSLYKALYRWRGYLSPLLLHNNCKVIAASYDCVTSSPPLFIYVKGGGPTPDSVNATDESPSSGRGTATANWAINSCYWRHNNNNKIRTKTTTTSRIGVIPPYINWMKNEPSSHIDQQGEQKERGPLHLIIINPILHITPTSCVERAPQMGRQTPNTERTTCPVSFHQPIHTPTQQATTTSK